MRSGAETWGRSPRLLISHDARDACNSAPAIAGAELPFLLAVVPTPGRQRRGPERRRRADRMRDRRPGTARRRPSPRDRRGSSAWIAGVPHITRELLTDARRAPIDGKSARRDGPFSPSICISSILRYLRRLGLERPRARSPSNRFWARGAYPEPLNYGPTRFLQSTNSMSPPGAARSKCTVRARPPGVRWSTRGFASGGNVPSTTGSTPARAPGAVGLARRQAAGRFPDRGPLLRPVNRPAEPVPHFNLGRAPCGRDRRRQEPMEDQSTGRTSIGRRVRIGRMNGRSRAG